MRLLITGGTGLVSGRVAAFAAADGNEVISITRGEKPVPPDADFQHVRADRDADDIVRLLEDENYDAVLDVIPRTPEHARQAVALAKDCRRLVFVSTDYVYHPAHRRLLQNEDDAVFSDFDDYGGDKRRAEEVVLDAQAQGLVDATILRPPHIYGPGSNPGTIPNHGRRPHLLDDLRAGKTLRLIHEGLGLMQPIHADDFARIVLDIVGVEESYGEAVNASGPDLMTHAQYYAELAKCVGAELKITHFAPNAEEMKTINPYVWGHRFYDLSKLNGLLPDLPYTPFSEGIADWVRHLDQ